MKQIIPLHDHLAQAAVLWRQRERSLRQGRHEALASLDYRLQQHILLLSQHIAHWPSQEQTPEWIFVRLCALLVAPSQENFDAAKSLTDVLLAQEKPNELTPRREAISWAWSVMILRIPMTILNDAYFIQLISNPLLILDPYSVSIAYWATPHLSEPAWVHTRRTQWLDAHQQRLHG